jgi:hypothetical protein
MHLMDISSTLVTILSHSIESQKSLTRSSKMKNWDHYNNSSLKKGNQVEKHSTAWRTAQKNEVRIIFKYLKIMCTLNHQRVLRFHRAPSSEAPCASGTIFATNRVQPKQKIIAETNEKISQPRLHCCSNQLDKTRGRRSFGCRKEGMGLGYAQ